jgi:hypothetical protein
VKESLNGPENEEELYEGENKEAKFLFCVAPVALISRKSSLHKAHSFLMI